MLMVVHPSVTFKKILMKCVTKYSYMMMKSMYRDIGTLELGQRSFSYYSARIRILWKNPRRLIYWILITLFPLRDYLRRYMRDIFSCHLLHTYIGVGREKISRTVTVTSGSWGVSCYYWRNKCRSKEYSDVTTTSGSGFTRLYRYNTM